MKYYTPILTIFFTFLIFNGLSAQELKKAPITDNVKKQHALAMHGNVKHAASETHFAYANPDAPKGGTLKMSAIGTFDTLNPYSIKGQAAQQLNLTYDRLMRRNWDEPFTLYPLIAQSITIPSDRSSITFHLNPMARFHDASPITAQDVNFSYTTLRNHGRPNMRSVYKLVSTVKIHNEHTISFTFGDGFDRETAMIIAMMPILSKKWWENRDFSTTLIEPPLTNGPYRIKSIKPGQKIIYERVKDYWAKDLLANKGHYNFEHVIYDYYRDDTIALEALKKGNLNLRREWDVSKWHQSYTPLSTDIIREALPHMRPERAHGFIFNMRKSPFNDLHIRKALSLAFDHEWIDRNLYHGQFKRIESVYPNSNLDGHKTLSGNALTKLKNWEKHLQSNVATQIAVFDTPPPLRTRLRQSNTLLKEAGWIIKDNKRINEKTGAPLSFELLVSTVQEEKIALAYSQTLKRLGIYMDIRMLDSATFQNRKNSYEYDMIAAYWQNSLSPGTEQMLYWSCKAAKEPARFNYSGICNQALDHFAAQIPMAKTYEELKDYAHIVDRIVMSEHIFVPFFYKGTDYIAHRNTIQKTEFSPLYGAITESWWMDMNN